MQFRIRRFLLVVIVALWLFAGIVMTLSLAELDARDFLIGTITGYGRLVLLCR